MGAYAGQLPRMHDTKPTEHSCTAEQIKEAFAAGKALFYLEKRFVSPIWEMKWIISKTQPDENLTDRIYYSNYWLAYAEIQRRNATNLED